MRCWSPNQKRGNNVHHPISISPNILCLPVKNKFEMKTLTFVGACNYDMQQSRNIVTDLLLLFYCLYCNRS